MEGLGGYASSSSGSDEEGDSTGATAASAPNAGGEEAAAAAAEAARAQRVAAMERSDSEDSDSDDSDDSDDDEGEHLADKSRHGNSKASLIALPSASDLMAGAGAGGSGIYHNPYEKQEIHTKRKLGDNENNTIFKKVHAKKKVYGQGQKPKTNSSVARSWTSGGGAALLPPQVARGRANAVTEDTAAWNVTKKKMAPTGMYSKQFEGASTKPMGLDIIARGASDGDARKGM